MAANSQPRKLPRFTRTFCPRLFIILGLLASTFLPTNAAVPGKQPNILWLIAEDMGPEALSRAGTPEAHTPNLDKLAAEGVYYSHAYDGMVCSVSRSSFMTGMYAVTIGAHNHRTSDKKPLPEGVRVLPQWLKGAGYFTANLKSLPPEFGFKGTGKTDWNFTVSGEPFDSADWADLKAHQPFYAQINFQETHRKYHAPAHANPDKVAIPPYYPDHPVTRKDWAQYLDAASELDRKIGIILKQLEADGLAENTIIMFFGDNGASMVRAKQFCYEEGFHVPLIVRWPSKLKAPKQIKPGTTDPRFIDGIDFSPTMLAIAGLPTPPKMQGISFLGEQAGSGREYIFGTRDRCDETVMCIRSVRDARYRLIVNLTPETPFLAPNGYKNRAYPVWKLLPKLHTEGKLTPAQDFLCQPRMPDEEFYGLEKDPDEIHNLAESNLPEHKAELRKLRQAMRKWQRDVGDPAADARKATKVTGSPATAGLPAAETHTYKTVLNRDLKLFFEKPADWSATDKRPAIVFFFGGGWVSGSPEQFRPQSEYLASRGMVGVRAEYRTVAKGGKEPPVPCVQDAKSAMRWIRAHAEQLGIDPHRIATAGGSAGGHLAAFTGMVPGLDAPGDDLKVSPAGNAQILWNPVFDNGPGEWGSGVVGDRYKEFSPAHNITSNAPPTLVFLGTDDRLIPVATAKRFEEGMKNVGVRCETVFYEGQAHGFFKREPYFSQTLQAADQFLTSLGWLTPKKIAAPKLAAEASRN